MSLQVKIVSAYLGMGAYAAAVQAYLKSHPGNNLLDLIGKDPQSILAESGYKA